MYWSVGSTGRNHADEHAWICLTSHIRVILDLRLWYYCSMLVRVILCYVACSVSKSFCSHLKGQHYLPPSDPRLRYGYQSVKRSSDTVWRLADRSSRFLPPLVLVFFFFFWRLYSVRAAIDGDTRCSYNRSHTVQKTNLQLRMYLSQLGRVGH